MLRKAGRQQDYQTQRPSPWQRTSVKDVHIDRNILIDPPFATNPETLKEQCEATIPNLTSEQRAGSNGKRKRNHQDQGSHSRSNDKRNRVQHVMDNSDTREPFMTVTEKTDKPAPKIRFDTISQDRSGDCERSMLLYALSVTERTQTPDCAKILRTKTSEKPVSGSLADSNTPANHKVKALLVEGQKPMDLDRMTPMIASETQREDRDKTQIAPSKSRQVHHDAQVLNGLVSNNPVDPWPYSTDSVIVKANNDIIASIQERANPNTTSALQSTEHRTDQALIKPLGTTILQQEQDFASLQQSHRTIADECLILRYKNSVLERILLEKGMLQLLRDGFVIDSLQV